ncbi:hypothetical protein ADL15_48310 [Actinoplanes awajinensis subsp. mycoplanecinus]|uniref:Uncharacterized protein n=2 Tax=Actinoplanes awajinensis TaxID=135946 RepID=A0A101J8V7_9ACTN|nr:hypothetical protein ADL15_48310 [Actinoplanes awajinensis subsp. mycoplanecinus]
MEKAVRAALGAKPPADSDKATAELALVLARQVDECGVDYKTSGALLAALEALQMSPRARAAAPSRGGEKRDDKPAAAAGLDELRNRRLRKSSSGDRDTATP